MLNARAAWLCAAVLLWATPGAAARIGAHVRERARADGRVLVVVALRQPEASSVRSLGARRAAVAARQAGVLRGVRSADVEVLRDYEAVSGFVASASPAGIEELAAQPDVVAVDVDEIGWTAAESPNVQQIRADVIHDRGITGSGAVIAILDSGLDLTHPDLRDALIHEECFCSAGGPCCPDGTVHQSGSGSAASTLDHGSHVAGIALSRGVVGSQGVAPGAQLVAVKVVNDGGSGTLSDWVAGLDWVLSERPDVNAVNMSLQSGTLFHAVCDDDGALNMLFSAVIDALYARGTLVFVAAGNTQSRLPSSLDAIASPACINRAVSVGAVDVTDTVPSFSDSAAFLDLLAPGVNILSDNADGGTTRESGTSMAAPHAAGVALLLYSANPHADARLIEGALKLGGVPVVDRRNGLTFPRLDAVGAFDEVAASAGVVLGGGGADTDCLLQWGFLPPSVVRDGPLPAVECTDNDPSCDADQVVGQCTFQLELCFNMNDPRVAGCAVDEPVLGYDLTWPRADGSATGAANAQALTHAFPAFPLTGGACTATVPYVVSRPAGAGQRGVAAIRLAVYTGTRRDYDRISFICDPP